MAKDGNYYRVSKKYEDNQKAAELMSEINSFTKNLIKSLKLEYTNNTPVTLEQKKGYEVSKLLERRYSPTSLQENVPSSANDTSYVKNKGEIIALCLREKTTGNNNFHSLDVLKFVMIHELAHMITLGLDHSSHFWTNFRFLLEFAEKKELYKSPDFRFRPAHYCGMTIHYNPIHDNDRTRSYF
jgi:hypothetical protein